MVLHSESGRRTAIAGTWAVALAILMLWPLRSGGYLLGRDMVFTPHQALNAQTFGLGSAAPRAVPVDALVAIADRVLGGQLVGRLALFLPLVAVGLGLSRLIGGFRVPSVLAAVGVAVWNPYVVERMAIGQWALLWCYAALPWIVIGVRMRPGWGRRAAVGLAVAAASITPTGGLIATSFVIGGLVATRSAGRGRAEACWTVATAVALQLPWIVASTVSTSSSTSDPAAVAAFAGRAEHAGGVALSLLGGGGIWNSEVVPASRSGPLAMVWLIGLVVAAIIGVPVAQRVFGSRILRWLGIAATVGFGLAVAATVPGGRTVVRGLIDEVPGAGLLRDGQKWVMPLVFLEALLVGCAVERGVQRVRVAAVLPGLAVAVMAAPLLLMPDAAATVHATVRPVRYPSDWRGVQRVLGKDGDVLALPFDAYRSFSWAPGRPVLDPAPRILSAPVVVQDRLQVDGRSLGGEDRRAQAIGMALAGGDQLGTVLAMQSIKWVLVERGTPGKVPDLSGLTLVYRGAALELYRVPGSVALRRPSLGRVVAVAVADAVAALVLVGTLIVGLVAAVRGRHRLLSSSNNPGQEGH